MDNRAKILCRVLLAAFIHMSSGLGPPMYLDNGLEISSSIKLSLPSQLFSEGKFPTYRHHRPPPVDPQSNSFNDPVVEVKIPVAVKVQGRRESADGRRLSQQSNGHYRQRVPIWWLDLYQDFLARVDSAIEEPVQRTMIQDSMSAKVHKYQEEQRRLRLEQQRQMQQEQAEPSNNNEATTRPQSPQPDRGIDFEDNRVQKTDSDSSSGENTDDGKEHRYTEPNPEESESPQSPQTPRPYRPSRPKSGRGRVMLRPPSTGSFMQTPEPTEEPAISETQEYSLPSCGSKSESKQEFLGEWSKTKTLVDTEAGDTGDGENDLGNFPSKFKGELRAFKSDHDRQRGGHKLASLRPLASDRSGGAYPSAISLTTPSGSCADVTPCRTKPWKPSRKLTLKHHSIYSNPGSHPLGMRGGSRQMSQGIVKESNMTASASNSTKGPALPNLPRKSDLDQKILMKSRGVINSSDDIGASGQVARTKRGVSLKNIEKRLKEKKRRLKEIKLKKWRIKKMREKQLKAKEHFKEYKEKMDALLGSN